MKKALWWIVGLLLSPVLLFMILAVLLYLPPVQNWAVKKVAAVASDKLGMTITVDQVCLQFPLDLAIDGFRAIKPTDDVPPQLDTIADVGRMVVDVQLMPLFQKRVVINELEVTKAKIYTDGLVDAACVRGRFERLSVASKGIDLDRQTIALNGATLEDGQFDIALADSVPEDTTTTEPTLWKIAADSVTLLRTDVRLSMPGDTLDVQAHLGRLTARDGHFDIGSGEYRVGSADWTGGRLTYDNRFEPAVSGLDYNHIDLTDVRIGLDSIYYKSPDMRLSVRYAQMKEKSGLSVSNFTGAVAMSDGQLRLPRMALHTPDSDIDAELDFDLNALDALNPGQLRLRLNAQLGKQDLMRFMGDMPQQFRQRWPNHPLTVRGSVSGNMEYAEFNGLDVSLPTSFHATATGFAANVNDPERLRAKVQFSMALQDVSYVTSLLPRTVRRDVRVPRGITAQGQLRADGANYAADVVAREGKGSVRLKGQFNRRAMSYEAKANVRQLNVHHFLPHDSIYTVSADVNARGKGVDIFDSRTTMQADATIHHVGYGHWNLDKMALTANVNNGRGRAELVSHNPLLDGTVTLDALLNPRKIDGTLTADVNRVDLFQLRLVDAPLSVGLCGHVDLSSDMKLTHSVSGLVNDLVIRDSSTVYRPGDIGLLVKTRPDTTYVRAQSGDFIVKLDASGDYERLLSQLSVLGDSAMAQYEKKIIDQPALRRLLPTMKLHVESRRDNPIATLLQNGQGVSFKELLFDVTSSPASGLNGQGHLHSLTVSDVRLDTICFRLTQRAEHLSFGGQVRNNKRNPQFVFNALFDGVLQERGATMGVRYYDSENKLGARVGAQAEMVDSGINIRLVPERPMLGYKEFNLNKDNYIFLGADNKVRAKVDLIADDGTGVKLYSTENEPSLLQDLTVSLNQFNLDEVTSVLPYVPRMTGLLNGDFRVMQDEAKRFSVVSDLAVDKMTYEQSPLGNVSMEFVYLQKEEDAHALEARLYRDDDEIGLLSGVYYNEGEGSIDAQLSLERLPLSMVNGFIPDQLFGFEGYAEGSLDVKGTLSRPQVNGEVYLDSSYLVSHPYGMRLRFDNDPVRIVGSNLLLENFTVYAHNDNPLNVMGNVDFSNLDQIMLKMRMRARDYQLIGAKETANSIAYGKAFVNFFGMMEGPLDNLMMRGRLDVLGTTDMSYVLRDTPLTTDNQLDELVKFTDFSDTTQTVVTRPPLTGFNMDLTVAVSKGAHIMAYLNTDHSNYIDLMGGGTLRMQYSVADNLRLTGRYTLSNGEMKYSLPVIPLKTFTIQDGSYIEFTGEPMNPTLNITATERTKATVAGTNGAGRSVEFDCGVMITKTLNDMGLEFTLDAPEDMQLHSELAAMSAEQRGKLAVTMLTTGMYLADGNTGSFSMNSALSSFLNSEINQITGNALRTLDLSFGMDNSTDATGQTHTDYSFKFAKRFWNNRLRVIVGGKVSTGAELQNQNNSFFDNVTFEYRLDDTANKYVKLFYENNVYDWLEGYTQEYGAGFIWRRTLQRFRDIFRFKEDKRQQLVRPASAASAEKRDTLKTVTNETK